MMKNFAELAIKMKGKKSRFFTVTMKMMMTMMTAMEEKNDEYLKLVSVYLSFESKLSAAAAAALASIQKFYSLLCADAVRDFLSFIYIFIFYFIL